MDAAAPPGVTIARGDDPERLRDYETLIRTYWAVPEDARELIETMNRHWSGERSPGCGPSRTWTASRWASCS